MLTGGGNALRTHESQDFGNVGIGTTNFLADLRIRGTLSKFVPLGYHSVLEVDNNYAEFEVENNHISGFVANSFLVSRSNTDDKEDPNFNLKSYDFVVKGNGCTGVGFDNPTAQLHVRGITAEWLKSTIPHELLLVDIGNTERTVLVATKENRVGINKFDPSYELDVNGHTAISDNLYTGGNVGIGTQTPNNKLQVVGSGNFTVDLYVDGNLSIGTNNPQAKLDVRGDIRINKHDFYLREGTDPNHGLGWYGLGKDFATQTPDGPVLYGFAGGALGTRRFGNLEKIALQWDENGKVFIGQAASNLINDKNAFFIKGGMKILACNDDDDLIDVVKYDSLNSGNFTSNFRVKSNGHIFAREIKVTLQNFPDYVFNENYRLESLKSVKEFCRINHHLRGIPSETEVLKTGLSVGELEAKLLEKVEELTLHVIQLSERIENLECHADKK
ncbi:MAG: hypothetical protein U0T73_05925 [Chitinophagales bacterium]